ncbi:hypothetical protein [Hyphobacterium sp.]|uniref:hypothetical protein n=1 Tax=Hyphobacterium sp. TaxID=2004662 RepID=UPI003BAC881C
MTYLIVEIAILLLIAFLIGLLIGWWFNRKGSGEGEQDHALQSRIAVLEGELDECKANRLQLRSQVQELQSSAPAAGFVAASPEELPPDDLKRISGIGPVIEGKLNAAGVTRFEQIAAWTQADVDDFRERLNFRDRIEREFWVDQAKMLARGEETDFSRRYDEQDNES